MEKENKKNSQQIHDEKTERNGKESIMAFKRMWGAIAVIALGLISMVMFTFAEDPNKGYKPLKDTKDEKSIVETAKEKDKQLTSKYINKELAYKQALDNNLDPAVLEHHYNNYFKELKINRSMDFGPVRYGSVSISTELSDNVTIYGSMQDDTMLFTILNLIGFDLHTDKEINDFKEITLAFFTSIANQDIKDILYKSMNFNEIIKNGGEVEFIIKDIKYSLTKHKDESGSFITFHVSTIKNP
ncbi:hypothetical protein I6J18_01805 [Peribacillus psychrosaccharolyticus]|uniref:Uncharacterized protein n=1 Tax=Peribacillus psychrosaccharolyticus TaxID=1407 RepID=A0A974NMQ4_PERPY|nr:hypothetical protein [Peribacillus psychrosaccharolyticus]MEC2056111.1 hypothetical protein [Peribacillus psychrosaccharolyticus]MED3745552.1 hypothetical protein [Peribacillus psychrosaccharolyticus]QQT00695.1 hypothetical protein I6J18_01805 [Peribacillus psychrosaccharolyticus]